MAHSAEEFFDGIREKITEGLHHFKRADKRFMTTSAQKELWLGNSGRNQKELGRVLGLDHDELGFVEKSLLHTVTILVSIDWRAWGNFKRIFLPADGRRDRTDAKICEYTFKDLAHPSFLNSRFKAQKFLEERFSFQPLFIEEGKIVNKKDEGWRMPFANGESVIIGKGSYGAVTEETIAPRQYRSKKRLDNENPEKVACKRFTGGAMAREDFESEMENLKILRDALAKHSHIAEFITIINIGPEFYILSPLAAMNLDDLLYDKPLRTETTLREPFQITFENVIEQLKNLVHALHWLHDEIKPYRCYHMDLKPDNILVYDEGPQHSAGKWKITDFGVSSMDTKRHPSSETASNDVASKNGGATKQGHTGLPAPSFRQFLTKATRVIPKVGTGTWRAPEVSWSGERVLGHKSDVWSYGCIFIQAMARTLAGTEGLCQLDARRRLADQGAQGSDNTWYRTIDGECQINPEVKKWIKALPQFTQEDRSRVVLEHCQHLIFLMLEIHPEYRPIATQVFEVLCRLGDKNTTKLLESLRVKPRPSRETGEQQQGGSRAISGFPPSFLTPSAPRTRLKGDANSGWERPNSTFYRPVDTPYSSHVPFNQEELAQNGRASLLMSPQVFQSPPQIFTTLVGEDNGNDTPPQPSHREGSLDRSTEDIDIGRSHTSKPLDLHFQQHLSETDLTRTGVEGRHWRQDDNASSHRRTISLDDSRSPHHVTHTSGPSSIPKRSTIPAASLGAASLRTFPRPKTALSVSIRQRHSSDETRRPSVTDESIISALSTSTPPNSSCQVTSNVHSYDVPTNVKYTTMSTSCGQVAFVTPEKIVIFVMTNFRSRDSIFPPDGIRWISASLSKGWLLGRGQKETTNESVFCLYQVTANPNGLWKKSLMKTWELDKKGSYVDGLLSENGHILFQGPECVTIMSLHKRQGDDVRKPEVLKVEGFTEKCWFGSTGEWAFSLSRKAGYYHINAWRLEDPSDPKPSDHRHYPYKIADDQNHGTPVKDIFAFPDDPRCIVWKRNNNLALFSQEETANWNIEGLKDLSVTMSGEGLIYITRKFKFPYIWPGGPYSQIFKATVEPKGEEGRLVVKDPGAGFRLRIHVGDDQSYNIAVDHSTEPVTKVLIAHNSGKIEEITWE